MTSPERSRRTTADTGAGGDILSRQSVRITPRSESFVENGVYTALVTVDVDKKGLFDTIAGSGGVDAPRLELTLETPTSEGGASLVGVSSSDYDENTCPEAAQCTISSTSAFGAGTTHTVRVRFFIDGSVSPDSVTLRADPTPNGGGNGDAVTYDVTETADTHRSLARAAEARATLAGGYNRTYDEFFQHENWNDRVQRDMSRAFTIVGNDIAQSFVTSYADQALASTRYVEYANNLDTLQNAQTAYGGTTAGKIARINDKLARNLLNERIPTDRIGDDLPPRYNSSFALRELARLSREEAEAWRNGNRERARKLLKRQLYVLSWGVTEQEPYDRNYEQRYAAAVLGDEDDIRNDDYSPGTLGRQLNRQRGLAEAEEYTALVNYYDALESYRQSQVRYIENTALPLTKRPKPHVTLDTSQSDLRSRLQQLSPGESTTVTFTVSNADGAGPTSAQGYLSVSHSEALEVTAYRQVGESDAVVSNYSAGGEDINYRDGTEDSARYPLTDIREFYDQGETNTYVLTLERQSNAEAWLAYRTAFESLVHDDTTEATFERYPTNVETRDQQNFTAFNISETGTVSNQPPTARISASKTTVTAGGSITFTSGQSSDDQGITARTWRVDGQQVSTGADLSRTFDSVGSHEVSLTVEDAAGVTDTATLDVRVRRRPALTAGFQANRSVVQPGDDTRLRATTDADDYAWDLDGDGQFDDGSGRTTTWRPATGGEYPISLRVSAGDRQDSVSLTYTVEAASEQLTRPTPVVEMPSTLTVGETGTFDASESTDRAVVDGELVEGSITSYEWDFDGDGRTDRHGETVDVAFERSGTVGVNLTLTDADGHVVTASRYVSVVRSDRSDGIRRETGWRMFGDDPRNTGYNPSEDISAPVTTRWSYRTPGFRTEVSTTPSVVNGTVYFGNERTFDSGGVVFAVDAQTGATEWTFSTGTSVFVSPAVVDGIVYVGDDNGKVYALDAQSGREYWNTSIGGDTSSLVVADGTVYAVEYRTGRYYRGRVLSPSRGILHALHASNGTVEWTFSSRGGLSPPVVTQDTVYVASDGIRSRRNYNSNAVLYGLHPDNGTRTDWSYSSGDREYSGPSVINGTVYISGNSGTLYAVNERTNDLEWSYSQLSDVAPLSVGDGTVYAMDREGFVAVDAASGTERWRRSITTRYPRTPAITNETVYVASGKKIRAIRTDTNTTNWTRSFGSGVHSPSVANGSLYVGTNDGKAVALQEQPPQPPSARASPSVVVSPGDPIQFDASDSTDENGDIVSYEWQFGDGSTATGQSVSHAFDSRGTRRVTVTVTDAQGLSDTANVTVGVLSGDGTYRDPYVITNASELQAMAADLDATYTLREDVSARSTAQWNGGKGFDPIGSLASTGGTPFNGRLIGNGKTITGLTIDRPNESVVGLFGVVGDQGRIDSVELTAVDVTGGNSVGPVAGYTNGGSSIRRVSTSGTVTGAGTAGGLVGFNQGSITLSDAATDVDSTGTAGGLAGGNRYGTIEESYATGSVSGRSQVGGLTGVNFRGTLETSYASGAVSGRHRVGGLTGANTEATVRHSLATGTVTGTGSRIGGLIGTSERSAVRQSYWDTERTGQATSDGGTGLTSAQLTGSEAPDNMAGFDFEIEWQVRPDAPPVLSRQNIEISPVAHAGDNGSTVVGERLTLDGTGSSDDDGIESYRWDLDADGTYEASGPRPTVTYDSTGTRVVTLRVNDTDDNIATDEIVVDVVGNDPPTVDAGADSSVLSGQSIQLSADASDPNGDSLQYSWTIENGSGTLTGRDETVTYEAPRNVVRTTTVTLEVTVSDGDLSTNDTIDVELRPPANPPLLIVDADDRTAYDTIQSAVDDATPGDTIRVRPGTYTERVALEKNVTLVAPDGATINGTAVGRPDQVAAGITISNDSAPVVDGFTIRGFDGGSISTLDAGDWELRNATVHGVVSARGSAADWAIHDSTFVGSDAGVVAADATGAWTVRNSTFTDGASISARSTSGNWLVANTTFTDSSGIDARFSGGDWTITESRFSDSRSVAVHAAESSGDWTISRTTIEGSADSGVNAAGTVGAWEISRSIVRDNAGEGSWGIDARDARTPGDATRNYFGETNGPSGDGLAGAGDTVRGNLTVRPFYTDAELTALSNETVIGPTTVNTSASTVEPTTTLTNETRQYEVTVVVDNVSNDARGEVDVRVDGLTLRSDADTTDTDLTIDYDASDVTNGILRVSGTVSAVAPPERGAYPVSVIDLRREIDGSVEYLIEDARIRIGRITVTPNDPPTASLRAFEDARPLTDGASVPEEQRIELRGGESTDPNDESLTYSWEQVGGPPAQLDPSFDGDRATVVLPDVERNRTMAFELTVSDGRLNDSERVAITVAPTPERYLNLSKRQPTYVLGSEVRLQGPAPNTAEAALYVQERESAAYRLVELGGRRTFDLDGDSLANASLPSDGVILPRGRAPGNTLFTRYGVHELAIVDVQDTGLADDGRPDRVLSANEVAQASKTTAEIRIVPPKLNTTIRTVDDEVAVEDGVFGLRGTAAGHAVVSVVLVDSEGTVIVDAVAVDDTGRVREDELTVSGPPDPLSPGQVDVFVLAPGRDGEFGDSELPGTDRRTPFAQLESFLRQLDADSAADIEAALREQTVDDNGPSGIQYPFPTDESDDLLDTGSFRLTDASTTVTRVAPAGTDATGVTPVSPGTTMVVEGETNLRPDDNAITLELRDGEGETVRSVETGDWASNGTFTAEVDTAGLSTGSYSLVVDDRFAVSTTAVTVGEPSTAPETLVVAPGSDGDYSSIRAAVDNASAGTTVEVRPGTYHAPVVLTKNVTVVAPAGATLANDSSVASRYGVQIRGAAEPTIAGLTLTGWTWSVSAGASTGAWTLRNTVIENGDLGVGAAGTPGAWTATNVTIRNTTSAVSAFESRGPWTIRNATIRGGSSGIFASESTGDWTVRGSTITGIETAVSATNTTGTWVVRRSRLAGNAQGIDATGATPAGNASYNWWGDSSGPGGIFAGTGDTAVGNVTVNPYYADRALTTTATVPTPSPGPANLTVAPPSLPANVTVDTTLSASVTVTNAGGRNATQAIDFRLDVDQDGTLENTSLERQERVTVTLASGERRSLQFETYTGGLSAGTYRYGIFTANDSRTGIVNVTRPPSAAATIQFDDATVVNGTRTVTVDRANYTGGQYYVVIHAEASPGDGSVDPSTALGNSSELARGAHTDVTVDLDPYAASGDDVDALTRDRPLVAVVHRTDPGANTFDGIVTANGTAVAASATVDVRDVSQVTVGPPASTATFTSIDHAIDSVPDDGTVILRPGTYEQQLSVDRNVTLAAPDGATFDGRRIDEVVTSGIIIGDDASPTISGITVQHYDWGVSASNTTGDWTLQNVTVRNNTVGVQATEARGSWRIVDSAIREHPNEGVQARRTTGDWRIERTQIRDTDDAGVDATRAEGDWTIDGAAISDSLGPAIEATRADGNWLVRTSTIRDNTVGVDATSARGSWTVRNTQVRSNTLDGVVATATTGDWTVTNATLVANYRGVNATRSTGAWTVTDSRLENNTVAVDARGAVTAGSASRNWWGATDGPSGIFRGGGGAVRGNALVRPFYRDAQRTTLSAPIRASVTFENTTVRPGTETLTVERANYTGQPYVVVLYRDASSDDERRNVSTPVGVSSTLPTGAHADVPVDIGATVSRNDTLDGLAANATLVARIHRTGGPSETYGAPVPRGNATAEVGVELPPATVDAGTATAISNTTVSVPIRVRNATNVVTFGANVSYDPALANVTAVSGSGVEDSTVTIDDETGTLRFEYRYAERDTPTVNVTFDAETATGVSTPITVENAAVGTAGSREPSVRTADGRLTVLGSAVNVTNSTLNATTVRPDDTVAVTATVTNPAPIAGAFGVPLRVDSAPVAVRNVTLAANDTTTVRFTYTPTGTGTTAITVGTGASRTLTVDAVAVDETSTTTTVGGRTAPGTPLNASLAGTNGTSDAGVSLDRVNVSTTRETNVSLEVNVSADSSGAPPLGDAAAYLNVSESVPEDAIGTVTFAFTVDTDRLSNPESAELYRYHDGTWNALETTYLGETNGEYRFETVSPGLSVFAVRQSTPGVDTDGGYDSGGLETDGEPASTPAATAAPTTPSAPGQSTAAPSTATPPATSEDIDPSETTPSAETQTADPSESVQNQQPNPTAAESGGFGAPMVVVVVLALLGGSLSAVAILRRRNRL